MSKQAGKAEARLYCGIDVSAAELVVVVLMESGPMRSKSFANHARGHRALVAWLRKLGRAARVSLEATGIYSLDLALALEAAEGIEVAVLNPRLVNRFAETMRRSKTDKADAEVLSEYSLRMPFEPWRRPSQSALALRGIARHLAALTVDHTRQKNRLGTAQASLAMPGCVVRDLKRGLQALERRMAGLRREARAVAAGDAELERRFHLLRSVPGIAEWSGIQLLGELSLLAPELTARQWAAHSGLDPAHTVSGSSVRKPSRISRAGNRNLRRALYMPALVGAHYDPHLKAFYASLLERGKAKLQALIAVARKMLHAIYGMFRSNSTYDGARLFPQLIPA